MMDDLSGNIVSRYGPSSAQYIYEGMMVPDNTYVLGRWGGQCHFQRRVYQPLEQKMTNSKYFSKNLKRPSIKRAGSNHQVQTG